jgi:superoxide dismutase, Cu-Zn family
MRNRISMVAATLTTALSTSLSVAACQKQETSAVGDTSGDTAVAASVPGTTTNANRVADTAHAVQAVVRNVAGRELGTLTLADSPEGIQITGRLAGLPPGDHGIHLHMVGQCVAPFASAGGHWNPSNMEHGTDNPRGPHLGDMRNIAVAADSSVLVSVTTPGGTLRGTNLLLDTDGAAIVVHAGADDYRSNPAGNSGDRVACGVVTAE